MEASSGSSNLVTTTAAALHPCCNNLTIGSHLHDTESNRSRSSTCLIDWEAVKKVIRPHSCIPSLSIAHCSSSSSKPCAAPVAPSPASGCKGLQHLRWQVVRSLHRDQLLVVERVAGEMTAKSEFPDNKCATFEEYYASR